MSDTAISSQSFSPSEYTEVQTWLTAVKKLETVLSTSDRAALLDMLNGHLSNRTTLLGTKVSSADVALLDAIQPAASKWTPEQRTGEKGYPHILRHLDFVQNSPRFELKIKNDAKVNIDHDDVRFITQPVEGNMEKDRLNRERTDAKDVSEVTKSTEGLVVNQAPAQPRNTAVSAVELSHRDGSRKDKKTNLSKPVKTHLATTSLSPALIDLRVGIILKAVKHPDANSLYVSTIAMGDDDGENTIEFEGHICRTVCSGLNGLVPLGDMQGRKVVVVCNLKPVKMRGVKSCAMVLAASPSSKGGDMPDHNGPVELVEPPAESRAGDRLFFEGWEGKPEAQLNPKKKVWETIQPGFTTTDELEVVFDAGAVEQLGKSESSALMTRDGKVCTVRSLKKAVVR